MPTTYRETDVSDLVLQSSLSAVTPDRLAATKLPRLHLCALSVLLWCVGVAAIRLAVPYGVFAAGPASWALLAATLPLAWLCLRLCVRVAGGAGAEVVGVAALVSTPALLLDGVAMTLLPWLYGPLEAGQRAGAAWVLWFVGATLALAFLQASRQASRRIAH